MSACWEEESLLSRWLLQYTLRSLSVWSKDATCVTRDLRELLSVVCHGRKEQTSFRYDHSEMLKGRQIGWSTLLQLAKLLLMTPTAPRKPMANESTGTMPIKQPMANESTGTMPIKQPHSEERTPTVGLTRVHPH